MARGATGMLAEQSAVRAARTRILHELLDGLEPLATHALDEIKREIPAYASLDERTLADVHNQLVRHYRANVVSFLEERDVTLQDIAFTRGAATRRARSGFALEDYLNAFRVGSQALWQAIMDAGGGSPDAQAAALTLVMPVLRYADFASTHAGQAFAEFTQYVVADADRERRDLLEHLLAGDLPSRGPLLAAANAYGLGLDARALVAVAVPVGAADEHAPDAASAALARAGLGHAKTLVVVRQSEIVAVPTLACGSIPGGLCDRLAGVHEELRQGGMPLAMGISTPASGVADLPAAYLEARVALECVADEGGVAALPRMNPFEYLALRADETARRLIDPRLREFLDEDLARGGVLTATIQAFAASNLNLRATADRLHVHPNTAQYRINRVADRTGRNLRTIADLLELLVAIALDEAPRVAAAS